MVEPGIEDRNDVGMTESAQEGDLPSEPPAEILALMAEFQGESAAVAPGFNSKDGPHSTTADHPDHPEFGTESIRRIGGVGRG
jgi:hypothetical protein